MGGGLSLRRLALFLAPVVALLALTAATAAPAGITVLFEADLRAEIAAGRFDPARDRLTLRGGIAPLSWQQGLALAPAGEAAPGRWRARVHFERPPFGGQPVPHKFRIERPGQGADEGWEPGPNHAAVLETVPPVPVVTVARVFGSIPVPVPPRLTGTVLTLDPVPTRHVLPRPVQVWLPPGYEAEPERRYPVLYLHDGQNVFDGRSAGAEWRVDETAQRLVQAGAVPPLIVVAVPSGRDRLFELTPTAMRLGAERSGQAVAREAGGLPAYQGGGLPAYARFLVDDLKPAIDARFRTRPGPADTAVGGSSLGGLASLWLALHEGGSFGTALVVSPSVWWDDGVALREAAAWRAGAAPRPRLWLDIGAREGPGAVPAVRRLRDALQAAGWSAADGSLAYTEDPDGGHDELSWAARFEAMLRFLQARPGRP